MFPTNQPMNSTYDTGAPKIPPMPTFPAMPKSPEVTPAPTPAPSLPSTDLAAPEPAMPGAGGDEKKNLLKKLITAAMAQTQGKPLEEVIAGVKGAVAAFKNYAKEYDNIAKETQKTIGM